MTKRKRPVKAKPGQVVVSWGYTPENGEQLHYAWDGRATTANLLIDTFECAKGLTGKTLRQELEERGYDIKTFRFSIEKKKPEEE